MESLIKPLSRKSTSAYMMPVIRVCALSAKMLFAPSETDIRETRSWVRPSALPNVKGLFVFDSRSGILSRVLPLVL